MPKPLREQGMDYFKDANTTRPLLNFSEAIRLDPNDAKAFTEPAV